MTDIPLTRSQLETVHALTLVEPANVPLVQITLGSEALPHARLEKLLELGLATRYRRKRGDPRNGSGKPPWIYELTPHGRAIGRALQPLVVRMREWRQDPEARREDPSPLEPDVLESGTAELRDD